MSTDPSVIGTREFQKLRSIRQNGLANFVFHGAEHSRFTHSLGTSFLAGEMYEKIVRNMDESEEPELKLQVRTAALLHDVGHGPFSHTIEEIVQELGKDFDHEVMTIRIMEEEESEVNQKLKQIDEQLPTLLATFIDKSRRKDDHWTYKLMSSQLDADRLDYLLRDALFAGLRGHGFDLAQLLDLLHHHDNQMIAVERGALEAVEAFLFALDQLYRAIYYHHTVRASNKVLSSCLKRAVALSTDGDKEIFPKMGEIAHPLEQLLGATPQLLDRFWCDLSYFLCLLIGLVLLACRPIDHGGRPAAKGGMRTPFIVERHPFADTGPGL